MTFCLAVINNLRHLPRLLVFATVAQKGSFTLAAEELGISKSAVSQQVSQLERDVGARVLNRTTRGVSLTALGERLLGRCRLLQDQVDLAFADIASAGVDPKGRFAVTYPHALETSVVLPALEQLCSDFSGLEPELLVSDDVLDLVAHKLDVAVHAGDPPDSSYRALPIGAMTEVFCATPLYLNRSAPLTTPEELPDHRWIATGWQSRNMPVYRCAGNARTIVNLQRFAQTNTLPTAVDLALRHLGVVLLPDVVASPLLRTGELVHVLPAYTGPRWPVHILHAYQHDRPRHIARFHQLIVREFQSASVTLPVK